MAALILHGKTYSANDIVNDDFSGTPFEERTWKFYRQWLEGQKTFALQSSGSTGKPKHMSFTREQLEASAQITIDACGLKPHMHALLCLDPRHVAGLMMIVRSAMVGMTLHAVAPSANPYALTDDNIDFHFAAFVPYQLHTIINSVHKHRLAGLQITLIGGASGTGLADELADFPGKFYETYGMTETLSHLALRDAKSTSDPFRVLPGFTISTDQHQCLVIRGKHLDGPVVTRDVAECLSPNTFRWLGRRDNIINSGGVKIFPEQLEKKIADLLKRYHRDFAFFVHGTPHPEWGHSVTLVIESFTPCPDAIAELWQHLVGPERPKNVHYIDHMVRTSSGKIDRLKTLESLGK